MKLWIKILIGLAVVGIIAGLLFYKFVINKSHPDYSALKPDYTLDAGSFYKEFNIARENAGKVYNGKIIEVTGKLTRVESADTLTIVVFAFEQDIFGEKGLRCTMLKKFSADAMKLKPDGIVRIKGYCTGYNGTDVVMEQCSIVY
jgi:hypothetical protein